MQNLLKLFFTDEGLDASDGSTGKLAPKRTSKTGRKKQGKQGIGSLKRVCLVLSSLLP